MFTMTYAKVFLFVVFWLHDCESMSHGQRVELTPTQEDLLRDMFNINVDQVEIIEEPTEDSPPRVRGHRKVLTPHDLATSEVPEGHGIDATTDELLASLNEHGIETERPSAHFLLGLYERLQNGEGLPQATGHGHGTRSAVANADTIRSFTPDVSNSEGHSDVTMAFQLAGMTSRETTHLAELRIRPTTPTSASSREGNRQSRKRKIKVTVYQHGEVVKRENFKVRVQRGTADGFDVMEITRMIRDVTAELGQANDTRVEITIRQNERQRNRDEPTNGSHDSPAGSARHRGRRSSTSKITQNDALLVVYSEDTEFFRQFRMPRPEHLRGHKEHEIDAATAHEYFSRARRDSGKDKGGRGECARENMVVDFDEIGWGKWIVYPKQFNAFQCSGRCPTPVDQYFEPTNHAILQSMMRLHYKDTVGRPCCAPTRLAPLSMLYYEYGEIVVRHHQDMVIAKCGCR